MLGRGEGGGGGGGKGIIISIETIWMIHCCVMVNLSKMCFWRHVNFSVKSDFLLMWIFGLGSPLSL